ncbi:MAG TPA: glycosyltransferase [Terriglobales bacterium]|nr:glycosyltransferase [Terriglobales bacterium]
MNIVIFGLSITSSWGNGHATTFRALARALRARGHRILFFEKDVEWYASNRDMPEPPFCEVRLYENWDDIVRSVRRELHEADVALVGSYFPDGLAANAEVFSSRVPVKAFYDIDTPITVASLRKGTADYLLPEQVRGFDIYFSFTGGPVLRELQSKFSAQMTVPLYCSFDPEKYRFAPVRPEFECDFSYMGTYAPDRQAKIEELFCAPARKLPNKKFILAGPQYPEDIRWPPNVERIIHVDPQSHASFYSSSRMTLNVTRREMVLAGYSPSVRLFEAAACGTTIVSDDWEGLDTFLAPGKEILLAESAQDVVAYLSEMSDEEVRAIGRCARERVLAEHTAQQRATEFENAIAAAMAKHSGLSCEPEAEKVSTAGS